MHHRSPLHVLWDLDDDPSGNLAHIAEHGISPDEVDEVLASPESFDRSRSSGRMIVIGTTTEGRTLLVVYEQIDDMTVYPITAYDLDN